MSNSSPSWLENISLHCGIFGLSTLLHPNMNQISKLDTCHTSDIQTFKQLDCSHLFIVVELFIYLFIIPGSLNRPSFCKYRQPRSMGCKIVLGTIFMLHCVPQITIILCSNVQQDKKKLPIAIVHTKTSLRVVYLQRKKFCFNFC